MIDLGVTLLALYLNFGVPALRKTMLIFQKIYPLFYYYHFSHDGDWPCCRLPTHVGCYPMRDVVIRPKIYNIIFVVIIRKRLDIYFIPSEMVIDGSICPLAHGVYKHLS